MKILFICDEFPPRPHGGIGTFVQTIAQGLKDRGHDVRILETADHDGCETRKGFSVVSVKRSAIPKIGNVLTRIRIRDRISQLVREAGLNVVEVPDYMGMLPFGAPGCVGVVRLHMTTTQIRKYGGRSPARGIAFFERLNLKRNHNWIGVSNTVLNLTISDFGLRPQRSAVIYNPAPPQNGSYAPSPNLPESFVLFAGQVSPNKGALVLAQAMRKLLEQRPDLHLVYAGGPLRIPGRPSIESEILEIIGGQHSARVHFLGHVDRAQVLTCMRKARVFAFPSKLEAMGLVVLEAMSCNLPVVCTSEPPGPELIEDGVNGLLADPDVPEQFTERVASLLDNPLLSEKLTANAQRNLQVKFSLENCAAKTESFYQSCLRAEQG